MSHLLSGSRQFMLGLAFVCVLAGTGGLLGAIGGAMALLLSRTVLGMAASLAELMPASVGLGVVTAAALGIVLMARQLPRFSMPVFSSVVPAPGTESK